MTTQVSSLAPKASSVSRFARGNTTLFAAATAAFGVMVLVPLTVNAYWLSAATATVIYAIVAASAGLLYGRLGIVSLFQIALLGVGGWTALRLGTGTGLPFALVLLASGVVTAFFAVIVGLPALRFGGLHLALITLMTAGAAEVVFATVGFPNGGSGFAGVVAGGDSPVPMPRPGLGATDESFFRYAVVIAALVFLIYWVPIRTRHGRAWLAIRANEMSAQASGINVFAGKLWALALTGFGTGIAGCLFASSIGSLQPGAFTAQQSAILFAVVLVGGAFSLLGGVIAGALAQLLPSLFSQLGVDGNLLIVGFGIGLVITFVSAPQGVAGQLEQLWRATSNGFRRLSVGRGETK